jgi:hypothetical protein
MLIIRDSGSDTTTIMIYGDGNVTAVYCPVSQPPPIEGGWHILYLDKQGPDAVLSFQLPTHPGDPTLPIPPRSPTPYIIISSNSTPAACMHCRRLTQRKRLEFEKELSK